MRGAIILLHVFDFFPRSGYYETFAFDMIASTNSVSSRLSNEKKKIERKKIRRRSNFSCIISARMFRCLLCRTCLTLLVTITYTYQSDNFLVKSVVRLKRCQNLVLAKILPRFSPQI